MLINHKDTIYQLTNCINNPFFWKILYMWDTFYCYINHSKNSIVSRDKEFHYLLLYRHILPEYNINQVKSNLNIISIVIIHCSLDLDYYWCQVQHPYCETSHSLQGMESIQLVEIHDSSIKIYYFVWPQEDKILDQNIFFFFKTLCI